MSQDSNTPPNPPLNQNLGPDGQYRGQDLSGQTAFSLSLQRCDFTQSDLSRVNFSNSFLDESIFDAARLRDANLQNCKLRKCSARMADFESATLTGADFQKSNLHSSVFFNSDLRNSKLNESFLQYADFRGADLTNADLSHANFEGADLSGADITGANLHQAKFKGARIHRLECSPEQRNLLISAGAYEGLPPFVSRLQSGTESIIRRVGGFFNKEKTTPETPEIETTETSKDLSIINDIQQRWVRWQERQENLKNRRKEEEEAWRVKQETERIKHLRRRMEKEEQRRALKQEADALYQQKKTLKKRLKERKNQASRLQRELVKTRLNSQKVQKRILAKDSWDPSKDARALELKQKSDATFKAAEEAHSAELLLHNELLNNPNNQELVNALRLAESNTRNLAQTAIQAETTYFDYIEGRRIEFAEQKADAQEKERHRRRQLEQAAKERLIEASIQQEEAINRAQQRLSQSIESQRTRERALDRASHIAALSREKIKEQRATEESERLKQVAEIRRYEAEQLALEAEKAKQIALERNREKKELAEKQRLIAQEEANKQKQQEQQRRIEDELEAQYWSRTQAPTTPQINRLLQEIEIQGPTQANEQIIPKSEIVDDLQYVQQLFEKVNKTLFSQPDSDQEPELESDSLNPGSQLNNESAPSTSDSSQDVDLPSQNSPSTINPNIEILKKILEDQSATDIEKQRKRERAAEEASVKKGEADKTNINQNVESAKIEKGEIQRSTDADSETGEPNEPGQEFEYDDLYNPPKSVLHDAASGIARTTENTGSEPDNSFDTIDDFDIEAPPTPLLKNIEQQMEEWVPSSSIANNQTIENNENRSLQTPMDVLRAAELELDNLIKDSLDKINDEIDTFDGSKSVDSTTEDNPSDNNIDQSDTVEKANTEDDSSWQSAQPIRIKEWAVMQIASLEIDEQFEKLSRNERIEPLRTLLDTPSPSPTLDLYRLFNLPSPSETEQFPEEFESDSNLEESELDFNQNDIPTTEEIEGLPTIEPKLNTPLDIFNSIETSLENEPLEFPDFKDVQSLFEVPTEYQHDFLEDLKQSQSDLEKATLEAKAQKQAESLARKEAEAAHKQLTQQRKLLEQESIIQAKIFAQNQSLLEEEEQQKAANEAIEQEKRSLREKAEKEKEEARKRLKVQKQNYRQAQENAYSRLQNLRQAQIQRSAAIKEAAQAAEHHRQTQLRIEKEAEAKRLADDKKRAQEALQAQQLARRNVAETLQNLENEQRKRELAVKAADEAAKVVRETIKAEASAQQALEQERLRFKKEQEKAAADAALEVAERNQRIERQEAQRKAELQRLSSELQAQADAQADAESRAALAKEAEERSNLLRQQQRLAAEEDRRKALEEEQRREEARKLQQEEHAKRLANAENLVQIRLQLEIQRQQSEKAAQAVAKQLNAEKAAKLAAEKAAAAQRELEARLERLTQLLVERQNKRADRLERRTESFYKEQSAANRDALLQRLESTLAEEQPIEPQVLLPTTDSAFQQSWYKTTDWLAQRLPDFANRLDALKESIETRFVENKAAAYRERERQKYETQRAKEARERAEHNARIERLRSLQESAEEEAERVQAEAKRKEQLQQLELRQKELLNLPHEERHKRYRQSQAPEQPLNISQERMIAQTAPAFQASYSNGVGLELLDCRYPSSNFKSSNLRSATFINTKLTGSNFDRTILEKSRFDNTLFEYSSFIGGTLRLCRSRDSLFTAADFSAADMEHTEWLTCGFNSSDFSQTKLKNTQFVGCQLRNANFTFANLEGAQFDQSDLTDANFTNANVTDADFRGAIGLTSQTIVDLKDRGALVDISRPLSLNLPQLRAAIVLFALAGSAFIFSYLTGQKTADIGQMEENARILVIDDPLAAAQQYEALSDESRRISDKVAYLLESAALYQQLEQRGNSERIFDKAREVADADQQLQAQIALIHSQFLLDTDQHVEALDRLRPFYTQAGFGAADRAQLIILAEEASTLSGIAPEEEIGPIFQQIEDLPDAQADLYMALAESRMERGEFDVAILHIQKAESLPVSEDLEFRILESRARIEDRSGDLNSAQETLASIIASSSSDTLVWQAAQLASADILLRQDEPDTALNILLTLEENQSDDRILARSKLIKGRIFEALDKPLAAIEAYQELSVMSNAEPEAQEEARVSLSRIISQNGMLEDSELAATLPDGVIAQAKLGQIRILLNNSEYEKALIQYDDLINQGLNAELSRAAESGKAEALAGLGDYQEADRIWRQLLSQNIRSSDRQYIMLLQAHGMIQSGRLEEATTAFDSLSQSKDPEIRHQGLMGLAEVARSNGERERAKNYYTELINETNNTDFKVDAYLELALISEEQDDIESTKRSYESILTLSPQQSVSDLAHSQLAALFIDIEDEKSIYHCQQTITPQSMLSCAELLTNTSPEIATNLLLRAYEELPNTSPLYGELCLMASRMQGQEQSIWVQRGLNSPSTDPIIELGLLLIAMQDQNLPEETLANYKTRFSTRSGENPNHAAQSLLSQSVEQRNMGNTDAAILSMETALNLEITPEDTSQIRLELSDTFLEAGQLENAIAQYTLLLQSDSTFTKNSARIGLAMTHIREQDYDAAVSQLEEIESPDSDIESQRLALLSQLISMDNNVALELFQDIQNELSESKSVITMRTEGQAYLQNESWPEAEQAFRSALEQSEDEIEKAWINLELVDTYLAQDKTNEALNILSALHKHPDLEVQTQSYIRISQWYLSVNEPDKALSTLDAIEGHTLGPGWDTSVEELRAIAYNDTGQEDKAIEVYQALAKRWPNNEEAEIPAWLGIAHIYQQSGTLNEARNWAQRAAENATDPVYQAQAEDLLESL